MFDIFKGKNKFFFKKHPQVMKRPEKQKKIGKIFGRLYEIPISKTP